MMLNENEDSAWSIRIAPNHVLGKPILILHVGPNKTGSSAIQHWLAANVEKIETCGIFYPASERAEDQLGGNGHDLVNLLLKPSSAPEMYEALERLLANYSSLAAQKRCHTVLLSSEFLPSGRLENLQVLRQCAEIYFEPRVVAFVRDPYWWLWSAWGQAVKGDGLDEDFQTYALRNANSYQETLNRCFKIFDDLRLLAYTETDVIDDFARIVGIPHEFCARVAGARINRSLGANELKILLTTNRIFRDPSLSRTISNKLMLANPHTAAYKAADRDLASAIREANAPFLASLKHLMVDGRSVLNEVERRVEISPDLEPDSDEMDILELILTSIKSWHDEGSPFRVLQKMVDEPAPEADHSDELPKGFNSIEYLLLNSDVLAAGAAPVAHYLSYGCCEGRRFRRPDRSEKVVSPSERIDG